MKDGSGNDPEWCAQPWEAIQTQVRISGLEWSRWAIYKSWVSSSIFNFPLQFEMFARISKTSRSASTWGLWLMEMWIFFPQKHCEQTHFPKLFLFHVWPPFGDLSELFTGLSSLFGLSSPWDLRSSSDKERFQDGPVPPSNWPHGFWTLWSKNWPRGAFALGGSWSRTAFPLCFRLKQTPLGALSLQVRGPHKRPVLQHQSDLIFKPALWARTRLPYMSSSDSIIKEAGFIMMFKSRILAKSKQALNP